MKKSLGNLIFGLVVCSIIVGFFYVEIKANTIPEPVYITGFVPADAVSHKEDISKTEWKVWVPFVIESKDGRRGMVLKAYNQNPEYISFRGDKASRKTIELINHKEIGVKLSVKVEMKEEGPVIYEAEPTI